MYYLAWQTEKNGMICDCRSCAMRSYRYAATLSLSLVAVQFAGAQTSFNATIQGSGQNNGRNDIRLNSVTKNGSVYTSFVAPSHINITAPNPNCDVRVVQGVDGAFSKDASVLANTNNGALETESVFESSALRAMQDTRNINRFIDITGHTNFSAIFDFSGQQSFNQLLWTERGHGGTNSFSVLTAVDANGNRIAGSKQYLIRPQDATNMGLEGAVYSTGTNPRFSGSQTISGQVIDMLSAFGVSNVSRVQVSVPVANGVYGNATFSGLGSGQDFQPDFRMVGAVPEPGTMAAIGIGLAGVLRSRRKKKAS